VVTVFSTRKLPSLERSPFFFIIFTLAVRLCGDEVQHDDNGLVLVPAPSWVPEVEQLPLPPSEVQAQHGAPEQSADALRFAATQDDDHGVSHPGHQFALPARLPDEGKSLLPPESVNALQFLANSQFSTSASSARTPASLRR
jgi:hypothetical protein